MRSRTKWERGIDPTTDAGKRLAELMESPLSFLRMHRGLNPPLTPPGRGTDRPWTNARSRPKRRSGGALQNLADLGAHVTNAPVSWSAAAFRRFRRASGLGIRAGQERNSEWSATQCVSRMFECGASVCGVLPTRNRDSSGRSGVAGRVLSGFMFPRPAAGPATRAARLTATLHPELAEG